MDKDPKRVRFIVIRAAPVNTYSLRPHECQAASRGLEGQ